MEIEYREFKVIDPRWKICKLCGRHLELNETCYQLYSINADIRRLLGYHFCHSNHKNECKPVLCMHCWEKHSSELKRMYEDGWEVLEVV